MNVGLQDPLLGAANLFNVHKSDPFVQILHGGNLHWLCISTYGCKDGEVNICDSLFMGTINVSIKRQICQIVQCQEDYLTIRVIIFSICSLCCLCQVST